MHHSIKLNKCVYTSAKSTWKNLFLNSIVSNECVPFLGYTTNVENTTYINEKKCLLPNNYFTKYSLNSASNADTLITNNKIKAMQSIMKYGPIHAEMNTYDDFYENDFSTKPYFYKYGMLRRPISMKVIGWNMTDPERSHWICMVPLGNGHDYKGGIIKIKFNVLQFDSSFLMGSLNLTAFKIALNLTMSIKSTDM